jgi:hypothetical protein
MVRLNVDAAKMMLVVLRQRRELKWSVWMFTCARRGVGENYFRGCLRTLLKLGYVTHSGEVYRVSSCGLLFLESLGCLLC